MSAWLAGSAFALALFSSTVWAQQQSASAALTNADAPAVNSPTVPPGYVIGPDDVLSVIVWRENDLSAEARVRPDGVISLPLINELHAAGLTPEALRMQVTELAQRFVADPTVTIVVKQINSRKIFITGQVSKPGSYSLGGPTTVLQLIAMAGGLLEYADGKNIVVMRTDAGRSSSYPFNYKDVIKRKNIQQNIELKPGDTVIVP